MACVERHINEVPNTFITKYVFSFDHKVIARQFFWFSIFWLSIAGVMTLMTRWASAYPGEAFPFLGNFLFPDSAGVIPPDTYASLVSLNGTILIAFAITPLLIGCFGSFLTPLMIGAKNFIFPTLNMLSFWFTFASGAILLASFFLPLGPASVGWASYPSLATLIELPGAGQALWLVSLLLLGISSIMGAINYITTVIYLRAPGMSYMDMPLSVWGFWLSSILSAIFVPVLGVGLVLLTFYPALFPYVLRIFSHPEIYILVLPAWGIVSDLLSFFSRKPALVYALPIFHFQPRNTLAPSGSLVTKATFWAFCIQ